MVKLYALSTCPWCKKTKKLLDENNVTYDVVDVDLIPDDEQTAVMAEVERLSGSRSFPVIVVDQTVIKGYDPDKILGVIFHEV